MTPKAMNVVEAFVCGLVLGGCGAATALIKAPVEQQCAGYGLKGCPDLVDGVMLYMDGDKAQAKEKIRRGAAQNAPEDLKKFARALDGMLPAETSKEIVALLTVDASPAATEAVPVPSVTPATKSGLAAAAAVAATDAKVAVDEAEDAEPKPEASTAPASARGGHVQLALAAAVDPSRMLTESVSPQREEVRFICEVAGKSGICVTRLAGPIVVTDARTPVGCTTELYVGAADSNHKLAWIIQANAPGVQGGSFFVRADQWLTVGARGVSGTAEGDPRCLVTWAGFRPRIVPANL